jgi:thymidylate synthase
MEINEKKAEDAWKKALSLVMNKGKDFVDRDNRTCREVLNISIGVEDMSDVTKPIEVLNSYGKWVYPPLEELKAIILSRHEIPGYYYNYGARAFNFNTINQVDKYVIPLLKKDSSSRRATVVFYDPVKDSSLFKRDIPSTIMMNFNIRDGKLNVSIVIRSNDLFFGWPTNLYQTSVMQKYVAKEIGCEIGGIMTSSISAHIFEEQFEHIKKIV